MADNLKPKVKCTLCAIFDKEEFAKNFVSKLKNLRFDNLEIHKPKAVEEYSIDIACNKNEFVCDVDEALSETFFMVKDKLNELKIAIEETNGEFLIDLVIIKYETYPAMIFSGKNMKIIHFLNADISLDCYDYNE